MNYFIRAKLKDDPSYKSKHGKTYNFSKYSLPIAFVRDMHEGPL